MSRLWFALVLGLLLSHGTVARAVDYGFPTLNGLGRYFGVGWSHHTYHSHGDGRSRRAHPAYPPGLNAGPGAQHPSAPYSHYPPDSLPAQLIGPHTASPGWPVPDAQRFPPGAPIVQPLHDSAIVSQPTPAPIVDEVVRPPQSRPAAPSDQQPPQMPEEDAGELIEIEPSPSDAQSQTSTPAPTSTPDPSGPRTDHWVRNRYVATENR